MVDDLVTIGAEGTLKKVLSIATNKTVLAWGYEENLTTLHDTLVMIHAKLRDADVKKDEQKAVMAWLKKLKHMVGEADNVLDEVHYETLRCEVLKRDQVASKVPSLPSLKKFAFRIEIGYKIKNISKKLYDINKEANDLGLDDEEVVHFPNSLYRETNSFLDEFNIVGREKDELHIIELLTKSRKDEKLMIVPIVGIGGIGKTTLAKSVFNNILMKDFGYVCQVRLM